MISVAKRHFADPHDFEQSVRAVAVTGMVINGRGRFDADLAKFTCGRLWFQRGRESLARTTHLAFGSSRVPFGFLADRTSSPMIDGGRELASDQIAAYRPGEALFQQTLGECHWSSMSLDPDDFHDAARVLLDRQVSTHDETRHLHVPTSTLDELRRLHAAADHISKTQSDVLASDEASRFLEAELIAALIGCLAQGSEEGPPRSWKRHQSIMGRFHDWLLMNLGQPVHLLDLCKAIDVPARTLRFCCQEHLGMSPTRYLWMRRMRLARQALLDRDRPTATVTAVAMEFGFWDLGHFAVSYRQLFGETPRETLVSHKAAN
jgi:AraC-like DNA-binding protein